MYKITIEQATQELKNGETILNQARSKFRHSYGKIEQACAQRRPPTTLEILKMEYEAVIEIASVLGIELKPTDIKR